MSRDGAERRRADDRLSRFLEQAVVGRCGYTAAVARVATQRRVLAEACAWRDGEEAVDRTSRFDLASLSKPFVATLATLLDARGRLPLETRIGDVLPEAHDGLARRALEDLLRHRAGLLPWAPLYAGPSLDEIVRDRRWWGARRGTYSDLGFMVFARVLARDLGRPLERELDELGLGVSVQPGEAAGVVRSRLDTGREVQLAERLGFAIERLGPPPRGRAQDGNARHLGGLPGHAGLFGDLDAVTALGRRWLAHATRAPSSGERSAAAAALRGSGPFLRGWRRATRRGSAGPAVSRSGFGHDGFTGGSLWVDPEAGRVMVLLGHRRDEFLALGSLRRSFHRLSSTIGGVVNSRR